MMKSLALFTSLLATSNASALMPAVHSESSSRLDALANASLKAIESSWLKVSISCKARTFNASPVPLEPTVASAQILALYQALV